MQQNQKTEHQVVLTAIDWLPFLGQLECFPTQCLPEVVTSSEHKQCPICKTQRAFRFTNYRKEGDWICKTCGGGKGPRLIKEVFNISYADAFKLISGKQLDYKVESLSLSVEEEVFSPEKVRKNKRYLASVYRQSKWMSRDDYGFRYLENRVPYLKYDHLDQRSFRFHSGLKLCEFENNKLQVRGVYPALLPIVRNDTECVTMHRHYVTKEGTKAPWENSKQQMGGLRKLDGDYISVVSNTGSRILAVGEGLETMCAVATAHNYGVDVRSFLNEGNLRKAKVSRTDYDLVLIYADHDKYNERKQYKVGEHAANVLATRLLEMGFKVQVLVPERVESDWCDVWLEASLKVPNLLQKVVTMSVHRNSANPFEIVKELVDGPK